MKPVSENFLIKYPILEKYAEVIHFTTTQQTFQDPTPRLTGEDRQKTEQNLYKLSGAAGIESHRFIFPRQTHSDHIEIVESLETNIFHDTDALITRGKGICICIQTADCVPVLVYAPDKKVIAVIHAGWRGTVAQITTKTIRKMSEKFDCLPSEMVAVIGPSIGPEVYEVGEEVATEVSKQIPTVPGILKEKGNGKMLLNLWEANRILLINSGLCPGNVEVSGICTYSNPEFCYSARYFGSATGRMVSGMMLR